MSLTSIRWQCPACDSGLPPFGPERKTKCPSCDARYYQLGRAPLLAPNADEYVLRTLGSLEDFCQYMEASLGYLQRVEEDERLAFRRPMVQRVRPALLDNLEMAREQLEDLKGYLSGWESPPRQSKLTPPGAGVLIYGLHNLTYLRTDWAGTPEGERQVKTITDAVGAQVEKYCLTSEAAVVFGAATGRHAYEFAKRFRQVIAVEFNFSYVHLFHRVRERPLNFGELHVYMPISVETLAARHTARIPDNGDAAERVQYVIADLRRLPLPDASQSSIISIYCSDNIPAYDLFAEVSRVLKPGGRFIHLGPFGYQFKNPANLLAPEEVLALSRQYGLKLEEERRFEMEWQPSPNNGFREFHQVWNFVLTKQ